MKRLCVTFLVLAVVGCDSFSEAEPMMGEYLERLGRVLDAPPAEVRSLPVAEPLPRRREQAKTAGPIISPTLS